MSEELASPVDAGAAARPLLSTVRVLGEAMDRFDDTAARVLGVARSDLRALNLLEHGAVPIGQIASGLALSGSSATALVDRLVAGGYVTRQPVPGDRRKVLVQLEPATYAAFARVYGSCGRAVASVAHSLPDADLDAACRVLDLVATALAREEALLRAQTP